MGVVALLAAPTALHAQITLYGIVDAAVEYSNPAANQAYYGAGSNAVGTARVISSGNGNSKGSRFGLSGSEDLGGGLEAIFTIETRLDLSTGQQADSSTFWNAQSWVGLAGDWGQLTAGRQYAPMFSALVRVDASGDQWYGTLGSSARYQTRFDNSVEYQSPTWQGLRFDGLYAFGETSPANTNSAAASLTWDRGPIVAAAAWQQIAQGASGKTVQYAATAAWRFGGRNQVGLGFIRNDPPGGGNNIDYPFLTTRFGLGHGSLYFNLIRSDFESGLKNSYRYAFAYDWPLSKRTKLYAAASIDTDVQYPQSTVAAPVYLEAQRYALGIRHDF